MTFQIEWWILPPALGLLALALASLRGWSTAGTSARAEACSRVVIALVAVAIGLRPCATDEVEVITPSQVDLVVLLDRTASMGARDHEGGERMAGAGQDLVALTSAAGANVSVIVFDDDARLAVPFTTDTRTLGTFFETVGWRPSAKATGSDISVAVDLAGQVLRDAAANRPDHTRFLVYAGDGEQTADTAPASFAPLAELVSDALVLGYGTARGGTMPTTPGGDDVVRVDGAPARSTIDEEALRAIADDLGGSYEHRASASALPTFAEAEARTQARVVPGREYYWMFALAGTPFLLHLLAVAVLSARTAREELR